MTRDDDVKVATPQKWMDGWNRIYEEMLQASDEELLDMYTNHLVQKLGHPFLVMGRDMTGLDVLELACGDGSQLCRLGKLGCRVTGVEALHSAYLVAKRRIDLMGLSETVRLELGDIDSWPVSTAQYDIIIAIQCLQYLSERAIPRFRELLDGVRPGGFIIYSGNTEPHPNTDPPIRFITPEELESELLGWKIHAFGTETRLVKDEDIRGYVWALAQKPDA